MKYKRKIQIGNNLSDIMALPCVLACYKNPSDNTFTFDTYSGSRPQYAYKNDWLCETDDGEWEVIKDKDINLIEQ